MSMSLWFALLTIKAITLYQREGMSSSFGVSGRWGTFVARAGVLLACGPGSGAVGGVGFLYFVIICKVLVSRVAQLCDAFELSVVCIGERGLKFTWSSLDIWLCHWPDRLGEFVVCV